MYEKIFTPIKIGPVEIPNRLFMPPMATGIGDGSRLIEKYQKGYYVARAKGGIGLIVLSLGVKSNTYLNDALGGICEHVFVVGDCKKGGNVYDATSAAFDCAWKM